MTWSDLVLDKAPVIRILILLLPLTFLGACATKGAAPDQAEAGAQQQESPEQALLRSQFAEAVAWKKEGQVEQAAARFLALSQAHPKLTGPLANLGILALERGDREQAAAYFERVIGLNPSHPYALNGLGVMARERGAFTEAEAFYRRALESDPNFEPALRNLAILLELYQGRLEEALALVERCQALRQEPDPKLKDWIFDLQSRIN